MSYRTSLENPSNPRTPSRVFADGNTAEKLNTTLVVIPVHDALSHTIRCLKSLFSDDGPRPNVLVVDNGSSDGTSESICNLFPDVDIINQSNLGYGAAANVGICESWKRQYKYTWILNNDTVVQLKTLLNMIAFMEDPSNVRVGACSPVIITSNNPLVVDFAGGIIDRSNWSARHINDPLCGDYQLKSNPGSSFLSGCALMLRNEAALEIGMFDERFFLYWEDCDFCIRLVNHGWQLRIVVSATVLHEVHGSSRIGQGQSALATYYGSRNCFLLWRQYSKGSRNKLATFPRMLQWIVRMFVSRQIRPVTETRVAAIEGIVDGFTGRYGKKTRSLSKATVVFVGLALWYLVLPWRLLSDTSVVKD